MNENCNPEMTFLGQTPLRVEAAVWSSAHVERSKFFSEGLDAVLKVGSRQLARFWKPAKEC